MSQKSKPDYSTTDSMAAEMQKKMSGKKPYTKKGSLKTKKSTKKVC